MKHRKKHFRAFIINKKMIITFFMAVFVLGISVTIFSSLLSLHVVNVSEDMSEIYRNAIDCGIPSEADNNNSIFTRILGFDITDKRSILFTNPIFSNVSYSMWDMSEIGSGMFNDETPPPAETSPSNTADLSDNNNDSNNIERTTISKGMEISNATDYKVDASALSKQPLSFKIDKKDVEVLIEHTHTTEAYCDNGSGNDRNLDETKNVIAVGEKICEVLNTHGIKTVHDKTVHDYPSYNESYSRSLTTIKKNIEKYPNIKVVLDVHRDAIVRNNGKKVKVCADIDNTTSSQVMLVAGTNAMGLKHDNWLENLKFASHIQAYANKTYPQLMRPINLREERFNTHMTTGSLIVEVGSSGNSLEEALRGAEYFAECLSAVLENT